MVIYGILIVLIYTYYAYKKDKKSTSLKLNLDEEIKQGLESLKIGMTEYIQSGETEYSEKEVEKCLKLIDAFLYDIAQSKNKEAGLKIVKNIVIKLNELNEDCGNELIETDQREQIANIIILAGHLKGYNERDEDITEEWREW